LSICNQMTHKGLEHLKGAKIEIKNNWNKNNKRIPNNKEVIFIYKRC
jgi:hypothetical protein